MVAKRIVATPDAAAAKKAHRRETIGVALYHHGSDTLPGLGANLRDQVMRGLPASPSNAAWDFLSIALAVFAADRFVTRLEADDGWTRVFAVDVAVNDVKRWKPLADQIARAMRYLTGDIWTFTFSPGGDKAPVFQGKLSDRDTVCLFSGGLDSFLGALKLLNEGKSPLLVSQGSQKEVGPQKYLAGQLGLADHRFDGRVHEIWQQPYEGSTRSRSLLFIAYGVVAATALNTQEVTIPENGLIAINPPMTLRRLGSLSTRTTHPHFLSQIEVILEAAGLKIKLNNIFEGMSKGAMLKNAKHASLVSLASATYSCGKGKRKNGQCGKCVPCLIRRASFAAAGVDDKTKYVGDKIQWSQTHDDVASVRIALARRKTLSKPAFERWVLKSGPLPVDHKRRTAILAGVAKGLDEVEAFLAGVQWKN
jgi:7-cyano-7-deazaguanine synthase in queuosine biosynthesis